MANKGTYSAYAQQPQKPSSQFEGADAFSRMAARKAQEKAREKQYQRQMQAEGRKAVQNAIEASNIDLSKFDDSVYGLVGKMLNQYGDEVVNAAEELEDGYSFDAEMKLTRLRSNFHSNVGQLMGLGNSIEKVREMDLDPILSLEAINGMSDFVKQIPDMAENFNPKNMSVNGKHIVSKFNEMVPKDKLVPFTDTAKAFSEFRDLVMDDPRTKIVQKGDLEETYEIRDYDPEASMARFKNIFTPDSKEFRKEAFSLLNYYDGMEDGPEKEDFAAKYLEQTGKGDFVVTPEGMFNYVQENFLDPYQNRKIKSEQKDTRSGELTTNQRHKLEKEQMNNLRKIEVLHEFPTSNGITGLQDKSINVAGVEGTIEDARLRYNPIKGANDITVEYSVSDNDDNVATYVARFEDNERGIQALGNSVFDNFDYIKTKRAESENTDKSLEKPQEVRTFEQRHDDINWALKNQANAINRRITTVAGEGDVRSADERLFAYLSQPTEESNEPNEGLLAFMAEYLGVKEDVTGGISLPDGVNLKESMDLDDTESIQASKKLSQFTMIARRMKAEGKSKEEIAADLALYANKGDDFTYEFDPVKKQIDSLAGEDAMKRGKYLNYATDLMKDGLTDQEVINRLNEGLPDAKKAAETTSPTGSRDFPQAVIDSLKTVRDDLSDEQINVFLKEMMEGEDALTYDEIVGIYTE